MDAARSMRAVKGSLGHSLDERYKGLEGVKSRIDQALLFNSSRKSHLSRTSRVNPMTPLQLIEMLDCKTCPSFLSSLKDIRPIIGTHES